MGQVHRKSVFADAHGYILISMFRPMWDDFYGPHRLAHNPIHNDDIIYTPSVTVFKSDTANPALLPEEEWYDVDVITCAAPNLRENPSNGYNQGDSSARVIKLHEKTKCT